MSFELKEEVKKTKKPSAHAVVEQQGEPLNESVIRALKNYFSRLNGEKPKELYKMMLAEVEVPLLEVTMKNAKHNQSRVAAMLGLSRGNLRTKLKKYGMLGMTKRRRSA